MLELYWKTLEEEKETFDVAHMHALEIREAIIKHGSGLEGQYTIGLDGKSGTWVNIYNVEKTKESKHDIIKFLLDISGGKSPTRVFYATNGTFDWGVCYHVTDRQGKEYEINIRVNNVFEGSCTVKKVKKTIEVFETDCRPTKEKEPC